MLRALTHIVIGTVICLSLPVSASATIISSLYGDKDGLGLGIGDGESFNYEAISNAADAGTITDQWIYADQSWSQTYDFGGFGPIIGGSLEIFTGGQGYHGLSRLFIDDVLIGTLTDGDGYDGGNMLNVGRLDIFDLTPWVHLLDGAETMRVDVTSSGDGWALDYSELKIETNDTLISGSAVPEPTSLSLMLLGFSLAGLRVSSRRRL